MCARNLHNLNAEISVFARATDSRTDSEKTAPPGAIAFPKRTSHSPCGLCSGGAYTQRTTLQQFQPGNLLQLWTYPGTGGQGVWLNCATECVLDLYQGDVDGGSLVMWSNDQGSINQQWVLHMDTHAQATAATAPALETASAD